MSGLEERYATKLRELPPPGVGCHNSLPGPANVGVMLGLSREQIFSDIKASIKPGSRKIPDKEIYDAISFSESDCKKGDNKTKRYKPVKHVKQKNTFDGDKFRDALVQQSIGYTEADLWEMSPYRLDWQAGVNDSLAVLTLLYSDDEIIYIGEIKGKCIKTVAEWKEWLRAGNSMPFLILNPLSGKDHKTKSGTMSCRCDKAVNDYRFALVEFDNIPKVDQVRFWHSVIVNDILDVAALVDSGNKSIHAWIRLDLADEAEWNEKVRGTLYDADVGIMAKAGADPACKNPARLSRLPGHTRDNGNIQKLLYLKPSKPQLLTNSKNGGAE